MRKLLFVAVCLCFNSLNAQVFDTLMLVEDVTLRFENDSAIPIIEDQQVWDSIMIIIKSADKLVLEGHTDEKGSQAYNQKLSNRRVESVRQLLLEGGILGEKGLF